MYTTQSESPAAAAYVVVTGASQGLGLAIANELARKRRNPLLVALPGSGAHRASAAIARQYGVHTAALELDLTVPGAPEHLVEWMARHGMSACGLVNNAGVSTHGPFAAEPMPATQRVIDVNIAAVVRLTHLLLPQLRRGTPAFVLNVSSLAAIGPMPFMPVYAASKAFISSFTLALREELADSLVSVSVVCPGGMATNQESAQRIHANGIWGRASAVRPARVARVAVGGALRGRPMIVPGWVNKLVRWSSALVPAATLSRAARNRFERAERRLQALRATAEAGPLPYSTPTAVDGTGIGSMAAAATDAVVVEELPASAAVTAAVTGAMPAQVASVG